MSYVTTYESPIGTLTMASDGKNLTGLWMQGQKYDQATLPSDAVQKDDLPLFNTTKKWLNRYFAGEKPDTAEISLAPQGSEFRQDVWEILQKIPYGQVTTYGEIAKKLAEKSGKDRMSSQAVGGAVGHNPIAIIIPCHRVVGSGGSLTGYSGGVTKKTKLLELEGADMSRLYLPKKGSAL